MMSPMKLVSQSITTIETIVITDVATTARPTPFAPPEVVNPLYVQRVANTIAKVPHFTRPLRIEMGFTIDGT
jgi:hypothetical protein